MTQKDERQEETSVEIGGNVVELGVSIDEALALGDILIVLLNLYDLPSEHPFKGRNIVAFDRNGAELWRVEPFWHTVKAKDGRKIPDSYRSIRVEDDGKLYAFQGVGYVCEIDLKTGKIVGEEFTR